MISLARGFYKQYFEKPCFKILIIGCDGAGKTVIFSS
jgi:GTPase SAR1 family protein